MGRNLVSPHFKTAAVAFHKSRYEASKININDTLLSYLRQNGQTDVKQMCEEGGCGACSVIEMVNTGSKTGSRAVSSCLVPLAQEGFKNTVI